MSVMFAVMLGLVMVVASSVSTMGSFYLLPSPVLAADEGGSNGGGGSDDSGSGDNSNGGSNDNRGSVKDEGKTENENTPPPNEGSGDKTTPAATSEQPRATSEQPGATSKLPKCDGSFQDCVTRNGDTCKAGEGGEKCECLDDMSDCQNHPSLLTTKTKTQTPDASCDFHPNAAKCAPDKDGNCPPGFSHNDKGNCHPSGPCPTGFFRHTDDESGKCFHKHIHRHHNNHNANNNNPTHTLKCDNEHDSCIGFCSTANLKGTETTFCFTKKECEKFRNENHGTECKRTTQPNRENGSFRVIINQNA